MKTIDSYSFSFFHLIWFLFFGFVRQNQVKLFIDAFSHFFGCSCFVFLVSFSQLKNCLHSFKKKKVRYAKSYWPVLGILYNWWFLLFCFRLFLLHFPARLTTYCNNLLLVICLFFVFVSHCSVFVAKQWLPSWNSLKTASYTCWWQIIT